MLITENINLKQYLLKYSGGTGIHKQKDDVAKATILDFAIPNMYFTLLFSGASFFFLLELLLR
jgi:hypothetical protein